MSACLLTPLDGSPAAEAVLPSAFRLASAQRLELVLLMVLEHGGPDGDVARQEATSYLNALAGQARSLGLQARIAIESGERTAETILEAGVAAGAAMAVLTTHTHGRDEDHLGGVAARLSRTFRIPALYLPPGYAAEPPLAGPVLVALDGSAQAEAVIEPAVNLALALRSPLTLVRIAPWAAEVFQTSITLVPPRADFEIELGSNTYLAAIVERLAGRIDAEYQTLRGHPAEMLTQYAQSNGGLLVLGSHGHSGRRFWGLGGTTDKVLRAAVTPVLVVPVSDSTGMTPAEVDTVSKGAPERATFDTGLPAQASAPAP